MNTFLIFGAIAAELIVFADPLSNKSIFNRNGLAWLENTLLAFGFISIIIFVLQYRGII